MLVEFSVENYRVFREEQVFSMVADTNSAIEKLDQHVNTGCLSIPHLHRHAAIYGANGAGKTSLVSAFMFMTTYVRDSHCLELRESIDTHPFLYDVHSRQNPSKFRVSFILDGTLYEYSFTTTNKQVIEEYLLALPNRTCRTRQLFLRQFDHEEQKYSWTINSKYIKGDFKSVKALTQPNALFLSTAKSFKNEELKKIYEWIVTKPVFISERDKFLKKYTASLLYNSKWKTKIINFLKTMDTRIVDIQVDLVSPKNETINNLSYDKNANNYTNSINSETDFYITFVRRDNVNGVVFIPLDEESYGTRILFQIAGRLLKSIDSEKVIILDEVNANLHPIICEELITLIDEAAQSNHTSQFIFTTHDVIDSEHNSIGKDQIWVINRNFDLSSSLYDFSEVDVPEEVTFPRGYLLGRYGGIPRVVKRGV